MRIAAFTLALLVALFGGVPGAAAAPRSDAKVVLIVGPAGEATQRYRERAEAAAKVAERFTSNVVRVYSPNATWPAVRQALDGAAVVVYLGHGNGWPSRYRDSLYGATQNGFGLNPVAGGDDSAHQYFGEDAIARDVRLARNAIVLLHHLCYASGNTEPGLPEGTVDEARQRVVNYAAGFIRAGAAAVVAEGHMGPAWYIRQVFSSSRSIDRIWRSSPNAHGNEFRFESPRSPGYVAAMDPDRPDRGFYRSIVYRGGVGDATPQSAPAAPDAPPEPAEPTLVGTGLTISAAYLRTPPVTGETTRIRFRYAAEDARVLSGLTVGVRWDPIDVEAGSAAEAEPDAPADPGAVPAGGDSEAETETDSATAPEDPGHGDGSSAPARDETNENEITAAPAPPEPDAPVLTWIQPERVGDVIEPVAAIVRPTRVGVDVTLPERPGRYRLVLTLHDRSGVAYDAATQALVPGAIVDVAGPLAARFAAPVTVTTAPEETFGLEVSVGNVGARPWGQVGSEDRRNLEERPVSATLVARWVALATDAVVVPPPRAVALAPGLAAGSADAAVLDLAAPETPGEYVVLLDVVIPGVGSLTALGGEPGLVRVTVR